MERSEQMKSDNYDSYRVIQHDDGIAPHVIDDV